MFITGSFGKYHLSRDILTAFIEGSGSQTQESCLAYGAAAVWPSLLGVLHWVLGYWSKSDILTPATVGKNELLCVCLTQNLLLSSSV